MLVDWVLLHVALEARALEDARQLHQEPTRCIGRHQRALLRRRHRHGVELHFTRRAKPVDNCDVESFHDKFRDECLSTHRFLGLPDARRLIEAWQEDDNAVRPHTALGGRTPHEYRMMLEENDEIESALSIPA
ncbi:MAG: transposase [Gemmatimonadaceae bacterium]|nr:transposase [Gemmatimonadaceae bacterium]